MVGMAEGREGADVDHCVSFLPVDAGGGLGWGWNS